MIVYFEELTRLKRAGGIESACRELIERMQEQGISIVRSADTAWLESKLPDCVHVQGLWSPQLANRFRHWKRLGVPCVISPHGMLQPWALAHKPLRKKIAWWLYQKRILNRADAVHATSASEADQFHRLGLTSQIVTIPWGISADVVPSREASSTHRVALFAGRLCPIKGLPMLFEAWKRVQPTDWSLRVVGPDEAGYRAKLESLVQKSGIQNSVRFEGEFTKPQLQAAFAQADLFILPSHSENFGMVVGEALSWSVPVLTTHGTPWQRISETKCGWWVSPTVDEITKALRIATAASSEELKAMGEIGANLIQQEFTWEKSAALFRELYTSLGSGPSSKRNR